MKQKLQSVYIYRSIISGGGCSRIIGDLIELLYSTSKFEINLISHICTDIKIDILKYQKKNISVRHINIPKDIYWSSQTLKNLANEIDSKEKPVLISFLDFDSDKFISICEFLLRDNIFWINLDTNHPTKIIDMFNKKNFIFDINYDDMCDSVDVIRLENKNFKKYFDEKYAGKIESFWNTVTVPNKLKKINFDSEINIININGLRETRKSILPFIKYLSVSDIKLKSIKIHIVGAINNSLKNEYDFYMNSNPKLKKCIKIYDNIENIHDFYNSCNLMITTATYEGTSNAVIEAFSHCIPVLCLKTSIGVNETVINGETGFICNNVEDMVKKILELQTDNKKFKKMRNNCNFIGNQICNLDYGTKNYIRLISDRKLNHNKEARNKLKSVSKLLNEKPWFYRRKLDALVVYVDLSEKTNLEEIDITDTTAFKECCECIYLIKYKKNSDLNKLSIRLNKNSKNKILYTFKNKPTQITETQFQKDSSILGLLILKNVNSVKDYMLNKMYDILVFYDSTKKAKWWLFEYDKNLRLLNDWQTKDSWLWMTGINDKLKNNCCFSLISWLNFDLNKFLKNYPNLWFTNSDSKINNDINLPHEIMKKIRNLY